MKPLYSVCWIAAVILREFAKRLNDDERREQRAKALADQEAQPTLFTDLK